MRIPKRQGSLPSSCTRLIPAYSLVVRTLVSNRTPYLFLLKNTIILEMDPSR